MIGKKWDGTKWVSIQNPYGIPKRLEDAPSQTSSYPFFANTISPAVAHTKGVWAELLAAVSEDVDFVLVVGNNTHLSGADSSALWDIAVGAVGSEVIKVANIPVGYGGFMSNRLRIPIHIPAGSRISCRVQSVRVSASILPLVMLYNSPGIVTPDHVVTMGTDLANSRGVVIPGLGTNVRGPWIEISAATSERFLALVCCVQGGSSATSAGNTLVDIAVGPVGSEVVVVPNIAYSLSTSEFIQSWTDNLFPVDIPAGSRLSVRKRGATASIPIDVTLIGVPA